MDRSAVVLVVGAAALGYWAWHQRGQQGAQKLLADAMVVAGGAHRAAGGGDRRNRSDVSRPSASVPRRRSYEVQGSRRRRIQRPTRACSRAYQEGVDADGAGQSCRGGEGLSGGRSTARAIALIGQTARLGLAAAHARGGQFDQAITAYKELAQRKDGGLPIDGILMELGRVYRDAGRASDAQQTFNRLIEEFPDSPFNADAKRELDALKKAAA